MIAAPTISDDSQLLPSSAGSKLSPSLSTGDSKTAHHGLEGQLEVLLHRRQKPDRLLGLRYASTIASSIIASRRAVGILGARRGVATHVAGCRFSSHPFPCPSATPLAEP